MKRKILLFSLLLIGGVIGVFSIVQANNVSLDESKKAPCRKHVFNCPTGWCCGYKCVDGIPTLPICEPEDCQMIFPCVER